MSLVDRISRFKTFSAAVVERIEKLESHRFIWAIPQFIPIYVFVMNIYVGLNFPDFVTFFPLEKYFDERGKI